MKITLDIKDSKFNAFLAFIKTLDYVSVNKEDESIPQWQEEEVNKRLAKIEKGDMNTRNWNEAKKDIFKK
jgi:hypothetical protein